MLRAGSVLRHIAPCKPLQNILVSKNASNKDNRKKLVNPADFPYHLPIQTRWNDNDVYGHVNNIIYYSYFDTIVNKYLKEECDMKAEDKCIGLVVHSECDYYSSLSFPQVITAGLRVKKLGNSSVTYQIAIFSNSDGDSIQSSASAVGEFVHVFVNAKTNKPTPIPSHIRSGLQSIQVNFPSVDQSETG